MIIPEIGTPKWSYEDFRSAYPDFRELYGNRPISNNDGGMGAPHVFATWFMLKKIQPNLVIESGVWKGQGTWIIEQACPNANVICIDPNLNRLEYRSGKANYFTEDFSIIDFSQIDKANSVCFFDDHQNALERLRQMKWKGFSTAIFEDNYPVKHGDTYSLKKVFSESGFKKQKQVKKYSNSYLKRLMGIKKCVVETKECIPPNAAHRAELLHNLEIYYEFPPLFRSETTRWGDQWDDQSYATKPAIFDHSEADSLFKEAKYYNWIALTKLR